MNIDHDDPLEKTQRLPIVGGVCNCPIEAVLVHVLGCPLRQEGFRYTVHGVPLVELGLDAATVVHPDGTTHPLIGIYFHRWNDHIPLYENIRLAFEHQYKGCTLVFPL